MVKDPRSQMLHRAMAATNSDSAAQQDSPHEVLILLRAQRQLYVKLEAIAEKQRGFITGDNSSELLTILADRQRVSKALAEIGQRLAPAREHWDSFVTAFNHEQREEAETIIASIRGSLQRVMERDDMDVKLLAARKHVVSKAMEATHNSRRAVHAYGSSGGGRSGDRLNQST